MVPLGARNFFAGIRDTQCGDPLAHGQERVLHCASSQRLASLGGESVAVAHGVDKEVGDFGFVQRDITEGRMFPEAGAGGGPILEDGVAGGAGAFDEGGVGDLQRSAEISAEAISGRSGTLHQGAGSGKFCAKWESKAVSDRWCRRDAASAAMFWGPGR